MRELRIPSDVESDPSATEMIRFWLANNKPHLSLLLGMYEDAEDCDIDELWAWGNILSDIAQHVANGLEKSHGWDFNDSVNKLTDYFVKCMKDRAPGLQGEYKYDA
jgi:hypothetical protein